MKILLICSFSFMMLVTVGSFAAVQAQNAGSKRPVAIAGPDQSVSVGKTVTLDGSGSSHANGDRLTYRWRIIAQPYGSDAELADAMTVSPTLETDLPCSYVVELVVNDGTEDSDRDTVAIAVVAEEAEEGVDTCFKDRHDSRKSDANELPGDYLSVAPFTSPLPSSTGNSCVPDQQVKAYGFFNLRGKSKDVQDVNFGLYTRLQYYSLTPTWDGNLSIPAEEWNRFEVTDQAHKHGSRVDLVISNRLWFFENKRGDRATDKGPAFHEYGLWLTKSFVLLTLIDEIAGAVNTHNFDGVTIDFRLPKNSSTRNSFIFFVRSLKAKLGDENPNTLLESGPRLLNIVVDDSSTDFLEEFLTKSAEFIDIVLVDRPSAGDETLEKQVIAILDDIEKEHRPNIAVILPNSEFTLRNVDGVGIWHVAGAGDAWVKNADLKKQLVGSGPKYTISELLCTNRGVVLSGLGVAAPILLVFLVLSWVFYDFPKVVKKSTSNLVLWSLMGIVLVVFILLLITLPSLDPQNIRVYVIAASFVIPLIYVVWNALSRLGRRDYP